MHEAGARRIDRERAAGLLWRRRHRRAWRRGADVLQPAETAGDHARRRDAAQLVQPARRERGDPRIEPVGEEVERASEERLEAFARQATQMLEAGAHLIEPRGCRVIGGSERVQRPVAETG